MQLVYSTNDLSEAERLSQLLADAGVATHIPNKHSGQLPGFSANLTPNFVGVWLISRTDLDTARSVMKANNFIVSSPAKLATAIAHGNLWVTVGIATAVALVVVAVLVASGP